MTFHDVPWPSITFQDVPWPSIGFHCCLLGFIWSFWVFCSEALECLMLLRRLWSLCKFCALVVMHGYAMLCLMLCCGYANAMQGYAWSEPKAVQSPDCGCAGSRLWLCWRSQWVQVWVSVGPSKGPCGSMCDIVWSGFALIWARVVDILRYFELQMWGKRGLEAHSCLPAEVLHVITKLSTNIHRCLTHVWQWQIFWWSMTCQ